MEGVPERPAGQTGTGGETGSETDETELRLRLASADAMITGLKELLAEVRQSRDQWQAQADEWKAQAEDWKTQTTRLTLALPAPAPVMVPLVVRMAAGRLSDRPRGPQPPADSLSAP